MHAQQLAEDASKCAAFGVTLMVTVGGPICLLGASIFEAVSAWRKPSNGGTSVACGIAIGASCCLCGLAVGAATNEKCRHNLGFLSLAFLCPDCGCRGSVEEYTRNCAGKICIVVWWAAMVGCVYGILIVARALTEEGRISIEGGILAIVGLCCGVCIAIFCCVCCSGAMRVSADKLPP